MPPPQNHNAGRTAPDEAPKSTETPHATPAAPQHAQERSETVQHAREEREHLSDQVETELRKQQEHVATAPADKPAEQKGATEKQQGKAAGFLERFLPAGIAGSVGTTWSGMKSSLGNLRDSFTLENLGNTMKHFGEFFTNLLEKIRPHFAWVASIPGLSFLIGGKENVRKLKEFFGIDEKTEKLIGEISKRMPEGMVFAGAGREEKALTQLEDLRKKVRTILKKKNEQHPSAGAANEEEYSMVDLFNDLKDGDLLAKHAEDKGGKKALTFEGLAKAAEEFAKSKQAEAEKAKK